MSCQEFCTGIVGATDVIGIQKESQSALMASIETGPTNVSLQATGFVFQFYGGGVMNSASCGTSVDHAMLAVGYGTYKDGSPYYLVKNSWTTMWGDQGYIMIGNNGDGKGICGI